LGGRVQDRKVSSLFFFFFFFYEQDKTGGGPGWWGRRLQEGLRGYARTVSRAHRTGFWFFFQKERWASGASAQRKGVVEGALGWRVRLLAFLEKLNGLGL